MSLYSTSNVGASQAILLYEADGGSYRAVILERPTAFTVDEMIPGFDDFSTNRMFTGGEDGGKSVIMISRHELRGGRPLQAGLFVGGVAHAKEEVAAGRLCATDFKFFFNHVQLTALDLGGMVGRGGWRPLGFSATETPKLVLRNDDTGLWDELRFRVLQAEKAALNAID